MTRCAKVFVLGLILCFGLCVPTRGEPPPTFAAIAFYSTDVEGAHQAFASDAIAFYSKLAAQDHFTFESTTDWNRLAEPDLSHYQVVLWLNNEAVTHSQRVAFERYMEGGGAWLGFHVSAYNDSYTKWPWFVQFLGGAVFYTNNWPPLPAKLTVDTHDSPVTARLPASYQSPANEFYEWRPSPRLNKDVRVLVTLDPSNLPLGKKDLITDGDVPVVWTNTRYHMLYINMGHGDKILSDSTQNLLFEDGLLWLGRGR